MVVVRTLVTFHHHRTTILVDRRRHCDGRRPVPGVGGAIEKKIGRGLHAVELVAGAGLRVGAADGDGGPVLRKLRPEVMRPLPARRVAE